MDHVDYYNLGLAAVKELEETLKEINLRLDDSWKNMMESQRATILCQTEYASSIYCRST